MARDKLNHSTHSPTSHNHCCQVTSTPNVTPSSCNSVPPSCVENLVPTSVINRPEIVLDANVSNNISRTNSYTMANGIVLKRIPTPPESLSGRISTKSRDQSPKRCDDSNLSLDSDKLNVLETNSSSLISPENSKPPSRENSNSSLNTFDSLRPRNNLNGNNRDSGLSTGVTSAGSTPYASKASPSAWRLSLLYDTMNNTSNLNFSQNKPIPKARNIIDLNSFSPNLNDDSYLSRSRTSDTSSLDFPSETKRWREFNIKDNNERDLIEDSNSIYQGISRIPSSKVSDMKPDIKRKNGIKQSWNVASKLSNAFNRNKNQSESRSQASGSYDNKKSTWLDYFNSNSNGSGSNSIDRQFQKSSKIFKIPDIKTKLMGIVENKRSEDTSNELNTKENQHILKHNNSKVLDSAISNNSSALFKKQNNPTIDNHQSFINGFIAANTSSSVRDKNNESSGSNSRSSSVPCDKESHNNKSRNYSPHKGHRKGKLSLTEIHFQMARQVSKEPSKLNDNNIEFLNDWDSQIPRSESPLTNLDNSENQEINHCSSNLSIDDKGSSFNGILNKSNGRSLSKDDSSPQRVRFDSNINENIPVTKMSLSSGRPRLGRHGRHHSHGSAVTGNSLLLEIPNQSNKDNQEISVLKLNKISLDSFSQDINEQNLSAPILSDINPSDNKQVSLNRLKSIQDNDNDKKNLKLHQDINYDEYETDNGYLFTTGGSHKVSVEIQQFLNTIKRNKEKSRQNDDEVFSDNLFDINADTKSVIHNGITANSVMMRPNTRVYSSVIKTTSHTLYTGYVIETLMYRPDIISKRLIHIRTWYVDHRYSDFLKFHQHVCTIYPEFQQVRFPIKDFFGRFESTVIEDRTNAFNKLLERFSEMIRPCDMDAEMRQFIFGRFYNDIKDT